MEWNNEEQENTKKGMSLSSKILLAVIACLIVIIVLIFMLLMNTTDGTTYTFSIYVDGKVNNTINKKNLLTTIEDKTYVNIEELAKLVGYEYHNGEYKSSTIEENKCYVEGKNETASFYINDNKIYKLPVNELEKEYETYTTSSMIKSQNGKIYASLETISKAFNILLEQENNSFKIYTLDYLVGIQNKKVIEWGYTSIVDQNFENKKAILYGYLIVKKEGGLYKIINLDNTKEIVLDRYSEIQFSENMQEFLVTNTSGKVGIVNLDGTTKIEPIYEEITVLDKDDNLYLIKQEQKYGVVKNSNVNVIYPQYDSIGLNDTNNLNLSDNKYLIFDNLIPVCKNQKWGAYNKEGRLVLSIEYDGFGYNLNSIEINGNKKSVNPVLTIKRCDGIVVKKSEKYGLVSIEGNLMVPIATDGIYEINGVEDSDSKYFMLYNGRELNVIERLIEAKFIKPEEENNDLIIDVTEQGNNNTNETVNNLINPNNITQ